MAIDQAPTNAAFSLAGEWGISPIGVFLFVCGMIVYGEYYLITEYFGMFRSSGVSEGSLLLAKQVAGKIGSIAEARKIDEVVAKLGM